MMLLLAEITWVGLGLLLLFGMAMFKCTRGSCGRGAGFVGKTLAIVAVLAGVWMLLGNRHERRVVVDTDVVRDVAIERLHFGEDSPLHDRFNPLGDNFDPLGPDFDPLRDHGDPTSVDPDVWIYALLGVGLVILGVMLFGRDKQRPFALKAITWLGIGAIIFAVSSFFVVAPQADRVSHRVVDARARQVEEEHAARRPSRPGRAKRPSLRPERPSKSDSDEAEIALPPRAGAIPVEIEIAKAAAERKQALKAAAEARDEAAQDAEEAKAEAAREAEEAKAEGEAARAEAEAEKAKSEADKAEAAKVNAEAERTKEKKVEVPVVATRGERPAWINAGPSLVDGVYRITVSSGPWSSYPECQRALNEEIRTATDNYINEYLGNPQAASLVNLSQNYLREHICRSENMYSESVHSPAVGEMQQLYAQLTFDERARTYIEQQWRQAIVQDRLWYIGGGGALVLALLATLYGYLKLELRTDSAGRGKLQLAATLVALIVAAGALLARWTVVF